MKNLILALFLVLGAWLAPTASLAQCQGDSNPACSLDWADGVGAVQLPSASQDGVAYAPNAILSCRVQAPSVGFDQTVSGAPGAIVPLSVPKVPKPPQRDVTADCEVDSAPGQRGLATLALPTFPEENLSPEAPALLD